jgi:hypothetical protein
VYVLEGVSRLVEVAQQQLGWWWWWWWWWWVGGWWWYWCFEGIAEK